MASSLRQKDAPTGGDFSAGGQDTLGTSIVPWKDVQTVNMTAKGNVVIEGNLTVTGNATEVTVDKLSVEEPMVKLAKINTGAGTSSADIGLYGVEDTDGTPKYHGLVRDADDATWKLFEGNQDAPGDTTVDFNGSGSVDGTLQAKLNLPAAGDLKIAGVVVGADAAELNVLDGVTAGTASASKAVVLDTNKDITGISTITAGTLLAGNVTIAGNDITVSGGAPSFSSVDINGGTIDGTTIATSNITVGVGKTLDVSAGTFSTSAAQKLAILQGAASDVDVGAFDLRAKTLTADDLTATQVVFAGTDGVLSDSADLTFVADTLTATKIGAFEAAGAIDFASQAMTNVDINSGAIDGVSIATSDITIGAGKTLDVSAGTITFAAGQIANVSLVNDSVSFGGVSLDLGQSDVTPAFDLTDATNYPTSSLVGTITNDQLAGSIEDSKLNTITAGDKVSGSAVQLATASALEDSTGLRLKSAVAGDGLDLSAGQILSVNVDDSSIETNSDTLRVKAEGVTNAMLAGSIANAKLLNSAVTITAGSGLQTGGSVSLGSSVTVNAKVDDSSIEVDSTSNELQVKAAGITNAMLAGSIENVKLANSTISFGGVQLALGASDATPAFDLADATNLPTTSLTGTVTNAQLAGSIANAKLANSTISGISLGADLSSLAVDNSSIKLSSGTTYNGSTGLTISVKDAGITNAMLAGSIENAKLSNSTISFGGVSLALGASDATPAFDLADATNYPTASLVGTITNAQLAGSIENAKLSNSTLNLAADSGSSDAVNLGESITFTGGDSISTVVSNNTITINADDASSSIKGVASFHSDDFSVSNGMVQIKSEAITNSQLEGSIADSKLSQIFTAGKVALSALEIDGESNNCAVLMDDDLFIVDDGADGTNSKLAASVLKIYSRGAISATDAGGDGSFAYNASTGAFTYTGPSASEVRAHVSGGTGVTITDGSIAIGQAVGTTDSVTFGQLTLGTNAVITEADAEKIDDITNGTAAANKALVLDGSSDIASINSLTASTLTDGTATLTGGQLTGLLNLRVDNLQLNGNDLKSTSGDLNLNSASGDVKIAAGDNLVLASAGNITADGDVLINGLLETDGIRRKIDIKADNYQVTGDDHIVFFNVSSDKTCTLPASDDSDMVSKEYVIKNVGSNTITFASDSQVDGATASSTTLTAGQKIKVVGTSSFGWQSI